MAALPVRLRNISWPAASDCDQALAGWLSAAAVELGHRLREVGGGLDALLRSSFSPILLSDDQGEDLAHDRRLVGALDPRLRLEAEELAAGALVLDPGELEAAG